MSTERAVIRVRCVLAGAVAAALVVYTVHRIGVAVVRAKHPEGSRS